MLPGGAKTRQKDGGTSFGLRRSQDNIGRHYTVKNDIVDRAVVDKIFGSFNHGVFTTRKGPDEFLGKYTRFITFFQIL